MAYIGSQPANSVLTSDQIADGAVTTNDLANNIVTVNKLAPSAQNLTWRNRIINGDMRIDQRNNGASVTPAGGQYLLDRWVAGLSQSSKYSVQQNAGAVTPPVGFVNYLGVTSLSAYSVVSSDFFAISQRIEGLNVSDLGWGTANAATVTLSFWVRSSLTGTFGGSVANNGSDRSYPFSYTISAANTWEQKSITIVGDTSGTWLTTNGRGLVLSLSLGMGSTYSGTAGSWAGTNYLSATGATSVVGTNGATFYITGVQLERGSVTTEFERVEYGEMLRRCQRYCLDTTASPTGVTTSSGAITGYTFPCVMRATPTFTRISGGTLVEATNGFAVTGANPDTLSPFGGRVDFVTSATTATRGAVVITPRVRFEAEL